MVSLCDPLNRAMMCADGRIFHLSVGFSLRSALLVVISRSDCVCGTYAGRSEAPTRDLVGRRSLLDVIEAGVIITSWRDAYNAQRELFRRIIDSVNVYMALRGFFPIRTVPRMLDSYKRHPVGLMRRFQYDAGKAVLVHSKAALGKKPLAVWPGRDHGRSRHSPPPRDCDESLRVVDVQMKPDEPCRDGELRLLRREQKLLRYARYPAKGEAWADSEPIYGKPVKKRPGGLHDRTGRGHFLRLS